MFKNYLKVGIRSLLKNRLISFINIFGLGLSMSVGMMVMIRVQDQFSYDNFHPNPQSTYRILSDYHKKTGEHWKMASTPLPLFDKLHELSGIENVVSIYPAFNGKVATGSKELYINGAFTEPSFFNVFGFSLSAGDPATALTKPEGIVISKTTAEKFFGKENPLGKVLTMAGRKSFIVTGVMNEPPSKSHINFDAFSSIANVQPWEKDKILPDKSSDWYAFNSGYTYIVVKKNYPVKTIASELNTIAYGLNKNNKEGTAAFALQNIKGITPGSNDLYNDIGSGTSWTKMYFEIGVALIILLAACFNYTNLTIARALTRAKEVGMRKINGASRLQIFLQYTIESVIVALLSLGFAWVLLSFIIQYAPFNDGYEFIPSSFHNDKTFVGWTFAFAVFTGLLAGVSPAWILSSFTPLRVLKNLTTARIIGKISIQKALIVFQYTLSLTIIIFLLAFYRQFAHLAEADPGFERDNVLVVPLNGVDEKIASQKLAQISGVRSVCAMSSLFQGRFNGINTTAWLNNKQDAISLNYYYVNTDFIRGMKLSILAGNNFPSQTGQEQYVLLNEQALKAFGLKDGGKAIGQKIWINDSTQLEIAGILKNFNYENAGRPIMPLALRNKKNAFNYLYLGFEGSERKTFANSIQQAMITLAPSQSFDTIWLDEQLQKTYSQSATISLLGYLAFMAIAIASLGLFGLVIYTVEVKRKEISIRKILGAESTQIIRLLSKGFIKLLFIAGLLAMPVGYMLSFLFLQNFADRVGFGAGSVLFCFSLLLLIGLATIISQTYKAATESPAKSLRTE
ncbi:MAG: ABC transporter permease [Bacteroidetes bacterium]|nr:ABC transporter permease [Bacteroidota bacterium]